MNKSDIIIQRQVEEALKNSRLLRTTDIRIETLNGEVTLYGLVDVLAEKWAATEIVQQVPGVISVDNSLTVATDRVLDDAEIASLIRQRMYDDPRTDLHQVNVTVRNGVAYLEGDVGTLAEEETAKEISAQTQGVKDVVSYLHVARGSFEVDDAVLTNSVETALSRTAFVNVRDVNTTSDNGTVLLTGTVDTPEQIEAAIRVVSQVPGVRNIDNRLQTRHRSDNHDYQLTNEIRQELGKNGLGGVKCFVVDGTVFLDGAVGTPDQKHRAEEIVSRFEDINGVNNNIQIS